MLVQLKRIAREGVMMCLSTFKRIMVTIAAVFLLLFLLDQAFRQWLFGGIMTFLTIALVTWVAFAILGLSPKKVLPSKKRH